MLNSKFDINSPEWIDRVFENRNKSYGAYDLRKHYASNLFKAFAITILSIAVIIAVASYFLDEKPSSVNIDKGALIVNNKPIKVTPETSVKKNASTAQPKNPTAPFTNTAQPNDAIEATKLDVKPLPLGGAAAWARFLETNLHYPTTAREQRLTGIVLMSFVIERNGQISNITVERPAGHGFDEEAFAGIKVIASLDSRYAKRPACESKI